MSSSVLIFFIVLLNSLWQLPALYFLGKFVQRNKDTSATNCRMQLILTIIFQWIISASSFIIYSLQPKKIELPSFFSELNTNYFTNSFAVKSLAIIYVVFLMYKFSNQIVMMIAISKLSSNIEISQDTVYTRFINDWSKKLKFNSKIQLSISSDLGSAFTYAHFRPIIVLPFSIITMLTPAQVESILLHEIAHIKNSDFIINIFLEFSEAIFSFNPFMWKITKEIKIKREMACDEFVMQQGIDSTIYATALYQLALAKPSTNFGLGAIGKRKYLLDRIQLLNNYKENIEKKKPFSVILGVAIICILATNFIEFRADVTIVEEVPLTQVALSKSTIERTEFPEGKPIKTFASKKITAPIKSVAKNEVVQQTKSIKSNTIITDKDFTKYDFSNATYVDNNADKNKTVAILQEENSDGTVTMMAVEIRVVNGNNELTPLWKWQSRPVSADSIRKNFITADSLRKYQ